MDRQHLQVLLVVLGFALAAILGASLVLRKTLSTAFSEAVVKLMNTPGEPQVPQASAIWVMPKIESSEAQLAHEITVRGTRRRLAYTALVLAWSFGLAVLYVWVVHPEVAGTTADIALATGVFAFIQLICGFLGHALGRVSAFSWGLFSTLVAIVPGAIVGIAVGAIVYEMVTGPDSESLTVAGAFQVIFWVVQWLLASLLVTFALAFATVGLQRLLRLSGLALVDFVVSLLALALWTWFALAFDPLPTLGGALAWCFAAAMFAPVALAVLFLLRRQEVVAGGVSLVFLRAFDVRSDDLLRAIARSWLEIGGIHTITGPDVARRPMSPRAPLAWCFGRLERHFIRHTSDLATPRFSAKARSTDGRYELRELPCAGPVWLPTVEAICADSHVVVMDLRGFSRERIGASTELELLTLSASPGQLVIVLGRANDAAEEMLSDPKYEALRANSLFIRDERRQVIHAKTLAAALAACCRRQV